MTHSTDPFASITARHQEMITNAVRTWADSVQRMTAHAGAAPDLAAVVDGVYDFAEQILAAQRALAHSMVRAFTVVTGATVDAVSAGAKAVADAAVTGTIAATEAARKASGSAMDAAVGNARVPSPRRSSTDRPAADDRFAKARAAAAHDS